jgi:membrane protease YdiL (CAAX protease family)
MTIDPPEDQPGDRFEEEPTTSPPDAPHDAAKPARRPSGDEGGDQSRDPSEEGAADPPRVVSDSRLGADSSTRPGLSTFTIEGRAAPALFVIGWLASILGAGLLVVGFLASRSVIASLLIVGGLTTLTVGLIGAAGSQAIERRARGVAAYTGPSPFLLFAASVALASLAASLVGILIRAVGGDPSGPLATVILLALVQGTYLALTRLLVVGTGALTWTEMGVGADPRRALTELFWGASFALPVIAVTAILAAIVSTLVNAIPESPLPATHTPVGLVLNLIGGALLVPIGEEVMFRGVATTAWRRAYGSARAIIQGALFFAVVHVLDVGGSAPTEAIALALVAFLTRVPVALTLGWLFEARRSIWASIGLHMAFNGILLILAELAPR